VWSPVIDLDKEITAAIVRGLGARSCFELGCFTGPVLSLLAEAGISVAGAEVSHTAFTFAYPNIREGMLFGDPLSLDIDRRFDVILCMDVLEHISPVALGRNIGKIVSLLAEDGFVYINSPMYGADRVFGTVFHPYLEEWQTVGDQSFWRHWPCDEKGWPQHGHLVWASVTWWSQIFEAHGLIRDHAVEHVVHRHLAGFFENAPLAIRAAPPGERKVGRRGCRVGCRARAYAEPAAGAFLRAFSRKGGRRDPASPRVGSLNWSRPRQPRPRSRRNRRAR